MSKPTVLFLCTHNAGRSQMALAFFNRLAGDRAVAYSGGSEPADQINPAAVAVMAEKGIDITSEHPKHWTDEMVEAAEVVVTMGCGDTCPITPAAATSTGSCPTRRDNQWTLCDQCATRSRCASATYFFRWASRRRPAFRPHMDRCLGLRPRRDSTVPLASEQWFVSH